MRKNTEKKAPGDNADHNAPDITNNVEALYGITNWFGAIFYYLVGLGKQPFSEVYQKKYRTRNTVTGWLLQLLAVAVFVLWALYLFNNV